LNGARARSFSGHATLNATIEPATPQRYTLRRSFFLRAALLVFGLLCASAVYVSLAPHAGGGPAGWFAVSTFAALLLRVLAYERAQPASLALTPDGIVACDAAGKPLRSGRIVGLLQWTHWLLVLRIAPHGPGQRWSLVVAADALPSEPFRELAVRARSATG
jgi:hypothetical protein